MTGIIKEERIGGQRLILGDCLEVMPHLGKFDAVVTDPPYGIEDMVGGYGRGGHKIANDKTLDVALAALNMCGEMWGDLRIVAFYSCRVTAKFLNGINSLDYFGEIIWDKKIPGMGGSFRYQHENAAIFTKGKPSPIGTGFSVISIARNPELHPHQKPIPLMEKVLVIAGGSVVLDPFMGSGTTLVACQRLGLHGTGIEIDPGHFDSSCRRVEEATRQPGLFISPPEAPTQETLL